MKARLAVLALLFFTVIGIAAVQYYAATLTVTKIEDTNDGVCDACPITGGESTENEMFIAIGQYFVK